MFIGCNSPALQRLGVSELNEILNITWAFVQVAVIILTMGCSKEYLMRVKFLEECSVDAKFTLGICVQEFIQRVASFELPHIFCVCVLLLGVKDTLNPIHPLTSSNLSRLPVILSFS